MTVNELKEQLQKKGLPIYGNKHDLITRLATGIPMKSATAGAGIAKPTPLKNKPQNVFAKTSEIKLATRLDPQVAASMNMGFVRIDKSGASNAYIYKMLESTTKATGSKPASKPASKPGPKPKADRPEVMDKVSDDALEEASSVSAWRMTNKVTMEWMREGLKLFGVERVVRSKKDAAELLAEQLHYETGSDSDDESDDE